jgi:HEAT repeat protein
MKRAVLLVSVAVFGLVCIPLRADEKKPEPKYEGKPLAYWVERLQKCEKDEEREVASKAIEAFGADAAPALPALIIILDDCSEEYRKQVGKILVEIAKAGAKPVVPALARLLKDNKARDKNLVISLLGDIGPGAVEAVPLIAVALKDENCRGKAAEAIKQIGPGAKDAVSALAACLKDVKDAEERLGVLDALNALGLETRPAIPAILEALSEPVKNEDDEGELASVHRPGYHELTYENLCKTLCINMLARFGPDAKVAVPTLVKVLKSDSYPLRIVAAEALWRIEKHQDAVPALVEVLKLPDYWSQDTANVLGEIGPDAKPAIPELIRVYSNSTNLDMRKEIAKAIKKIDPEKAKELKRASALPSSLGTIIAPLPPTLPAKDP